MRIGNDLIETADTSTVNDDEGEPLEALSVDDFADEEEEQDDDETGEEDWDDEDVDDDDSDAFYTAPRLGVRLGGSGVRLGGPAPVTDLSVVADIVESVIGATPAPPAPARTPYVDDAAGVEVKESYREGSFATDGKPLDSEVMVQDEDHVPFKVRVGGQVEAPASPPRSDRALPMLALMTSTAGMMAGAAITAVGLMALASIISALDAPEPQPEPIGLEEPAPPEPEPEPEQPPAAGEDDAEDEEGAEGEGDTGVEPEADEQEPTTPRPRRRRRAPEPEPEPEPEPVAPPPKPAPKPVAPEPEPEPEEEKKKRGLFRRKDKD